MTGCVLVAKFVLHRDKPRVVLQAVGRSPFSPRMRMMGWALDGSGTCRSARLVAEAPFEQSAPSEKKGYQQQQVTVVAEETAPRAEERPAAPESVSGTGGPARTRWTARRRQQRLEQENRSGMATDSGAVSVAISNAAEHAGPSEVPHGRANEGLDSTFIQLPRDEGDRLPWHRIRTAQGRLTNSQRREVRPEQMKLGARTPWLFPALRRRPRLRGTRGEFRNRVVFVFGCLTIEHFSWQQGPRGWLSHCGRRIQ